MVGARRTRAAGASPGGFKSLDDIPKPTRGKGKKIKTGSVEPSIESESIDPFITSAEGNNNTESQKASSPPSPTNPSRTNSPDSHSPSPTPVNSRLDSRSTSPPKNNTTSNDASSDNDVVDQEQNAQRIAHLGSNRKRSRVSEPSTHQSVGITKEDAEDDEHRASKRTRRQESQDTEDAGVENEKSTEPEPAPEKKPKGRPRTRAKATPKKPASKTRGGKQDPVVLNDSSSDGSSDEAAESTVSPFQPRLNSTPKQAAAPSPRTPQNQQELISSEEDEPQAGPSTVSHSTSKPTLPSPDIRPVPQAEAQKPAPSSTETGPSPSKPRALPPVARPIARAISTSSIRITPGMGKTERLRLMILHPEQSASPTKEKEVVKEVTKEIAQSTNDVAQNELKKTTAVASSSETLSKSDVPHSRRQSPRDGLELTDPYLVAINKVFTNHKNKSKAMPSIEQVTAFLNGFDAQQASHDGKRRTVTQKPARPLQPITSNRSGFVVPGYGSDDDTDMSDEDETPVVPEPKTPEAPVTPVQTESPRSYWWNPLSTVATMLTSPFRKQADAAPAPLPCNKLAPPPSIFSQPPTTPSAVPLKRMSHSDRKRNTRNNVQGRLGGFQTERRLRHEDIGGSRNSRSGLFTLAELKEIHRAQDEYAAKHQNRGPSIVANRDIHKAARAAQRESQAKKAAVADAVEEETSSFTHVPAGEKRDASGTPKAPCQRWNNFLQSNTDSDSDSDSEPDYGSRWIRCRNGLFIRANSTDKQYLWGDLGDDIDWEDHYRDIDAFQKQDIYKGAGVQNPLNSAQLLEQATLRARGDPDIPDESENDYTYVIDERQQRWLFYPRSPYDRFQVPGKRLTATHIANIKEGLPLLNPRDEYGIAIKVPTGEPGDNIFNQLAEQQRRAQYKDAVEMKAGRTLEAKRWTQTPPPKPKPVNAKLPGTVESTPAPISEAVQHAMKKANKYLPTKGSGLRQVSTMSPVQTDQEKGLKAAKDSKPMFNFDFTAASIGWNADPLVMARVQERLGEGYIPITPMPDHIWHEHDDLQQGPVEQAVAALLEGIDSRMFGSMHNGIQDPSRPQPKYWDELPESPVAERPIKLW
ncbi:uncharacterized protein EAF01_002209 [Botrytis porri]|uniref:uncharacterized protein n=1 Tax=Botrytis porri TaxID=87229 RepID=UPI001901686B|nr:uncharacterized protein EAF01_002209 [Botrytis porri]KAF7910699.1 hypothetical protein EAF01_002209 [Botrytis porri]